MKNFIPFFSVAVAAICLQNCCNRDEEITPNYHSQDEVQTALIQKVDSTKTAEDTVDPNPPEPPVRDGDNWRSNTLK